MKQQIGQITDFNGYTGKIKYEDETYLLLDTNITEKKQKLQVNDEVEFIPETVNKTKIARFVKKRYPKIN